MEKCFCRTSAEDFNGNVFLQSYQLPLRIVMDHRQEILAQSLSTFLASGLRAPEN